MVRAPAILLLTGLLLAAAPAAMACEYDGVPGFNHSTGQIDADPYAGAYAEAAEKIAADRRAAAIERARLAFVQRFAGAPAVTATAATATAATAAAPGAGAVQLATATPDATAR